MGYTTYDIIKEKGLKPWFFTSYGTPNYHSHFRSATDNSLLFSLPRDPRISRITNVLAAGGEGSVYRHPADPNRLIKVIKFNPNATICDMNFFIQSTTEEADIFSKIHNDEVKIYIRKYEPKEVRRKMEDRNRTIISKSSCSIYIDMKKIEGRPLFDKKSSRAVNFSHLPLTQKWKFIQALLSAYKPLIEKNLVHRDIKPGNIIFTQTEQGDFNVNLIDFAWTLENGTQQKSRFGTPSYYSKNALNEDATITHRDAMYALCMVLFETVLPQERDKVYFAMNIQYEVYYIPTHSYAIKRLNDDGVYSRDFNSKSRKTDILDHYKDSNDKDLIEFIYSLGTHDVVDAAFIDAKVEEASKKIEPVSQCSGDPSASSSLIYKEQNRSYFKCFK